VRKKSAVGRTPDSETEAHEAESFLLDARWALTKNTTRGKTERSYIYDTLFANRTLKDIVNEGGIPGPKLRQRWQGQ